MARPECHSRRPSTAGGETAAADEAGGGLPDGYRVRSAACAAGALGERATGFVGKMAILGLPLGLCADAGCAGPPEEGRGLPGLRGDDAAPCGAAPGDSRSVAGARCTADAGEELSRSPSAEPRACAPASARGSRTPSRSGGGLFLPPPGCARAATSSSPPGAAASPRARCRQPRKISEVSAATCAAAGSPGRACRCASGGCARKASQLALGSGGGHDARSAPAPCCGRASSRATDLPDVESGWSAPARSALGRPAPRESGPAPARASAGAPSAERAGCALAAEIRRIAAASLSRMRQSDALSCVAPSGCSAPTAAPQSAAGAADARVWPGGAQARAAAAPSGDAGAAPGSARSGRAPNAPRAACAGTGAPCLGADASAGGGRGA